MRMPSMMDPFGDFGGFDDDRPAMPSFRTSAPDPVGLGTGLFSMKASQLSDTARMSGAPTASRAFGGLAKKLPFAGGAYTGYQTYQNNPANLTTPGRVLHGMSTGLASALTPTPIGLADAATGNRMGNAIEDLSGSMLGSVFSNRQ